MNAQPVDRPAPPPENVSLRELNQRSGRIIAQVTESGRPVTITDRGRPVAQIIPIRPDETPRERLLREGKLRPAKGPFRLPKVLGKLPEGMTVEQLLAEDREEIDLNALR
ncbi:MAG: type II toxin-antitoxin system prevent-host-death family antitoxin [Propionibacteriaceae bacterium]|nr:type II toxin-antitoxin system prevent-host-death family antitoxin [Propionibacteriaceae bacterium]